jgi:hypothetical protein
MKQQRDDVDRLLSLAHSTSTRSRPWSSRRQREAITSVHSPSVRGAQTDDLRAQLNRRSTGEDARISMERAGSADKTSRVATSIEISLRKHRRHQWVPGPKRVSPWPVWAAPPSQTIYARRHGRPSFGRTCRKNRMEHQTRRSSCRCTSPPSQQQVETPR